MKRTLIASLLALALSACGASTNGLSPGSGNNGGGGGPVSNIGTNVLQFAVGTANIYGTAVGLNVVVTYRQNTGNAKPGDSAVAISSPSLRVAGALPAATNCGAAANVCPVDPTSTILFGPGPQDAANMMHPTSQNPGASGTTTFGQSGGAFGLGIEPFNQYGPANAPSPGQIGSPFTYTPYPIPIYNPIKSVTSSAAAGTYPTITPWGGPPAFDLLGNGQSPVGTEPNGIAGISEGIDVFAMAPKSGSYALSVLVPTSNQGNTTQTKSAHLNAGIGIGTAIAPVFVADGKGGGKFVVAFPTGATEAYVQIVDGGNGASSGNCNGANGAAIYYTLLVKKPGTVSLPDSAGPSGTPSVCTGAQNKGTGDSIQVNLVAFDYPIYEASYYKGGSGPFLTKPKILGSHGQDDISISAASTQTSPMMAGRSSVRRGGLVLPGHRYRFVRGVRPPIN